MRDYQFVASLHGLFLWFGNEHGAVLFRHVVAGSSLCDHPAATLMHGNAALVHVCACVTLVSLLSDLSVTGPC